MSFFLFLCAFFTINGRYCCAETWTAACEVFFPPYNFVGGSGGPEGLDTEIVKAVMKEIGVELKLKTVPWERVVRMLNRGEVDFAYQFVGVPSRFERYIMIGPFRHGKTVFAVRDDSVLYAYRDLRDLTGRKIGVVKGYSYTEEFDSADYLEKVETAGSEVMVKRLAAGQLDMIIGDLMTLTYVAKNQRSYDKIRFLDRVLRVVPRYIAFNKTEPYKAGRFEEGLIGIKKNGTYDRIMSK